MLMNKIKEEDIRRVLEKLFLNQAIDFERGIPISSVNEDYELIEECFLRRYICFEEGKVFITQKGVSYLLAKYS